MPTLQTDCDDGTAIVRLHLPLPRALLERVDDYRFTARLRNRSEAIRDLISSGLDAKKSDS